MTKQKVAGYFCVYFQKNRILDMPVFFLKENKEKICLMSHSFEETRQLQHHLKALEDRFLVTQKLIW